MREAVSDILDERAQMVRGMSGTLMVSLAAHAALLSTLFLAPEFWSRTTALNEKPMIISLAGAEGPEAGGMNPLSARPVQEVAPPTPRVREAPPAPKAPEMVTPEAASKPKPLPKTPTKPIEKPVETSSRKPTTGSEVRGGSAVAETGSTTQVPFGGLSTGGGAGTGARVDASNFCCPEYLRTMIQMIRRNWQQNVGARGKVTMKFVVQRDGRITQIEVEESGGQFLDLASRRALVATNQIPPLPREFPESTLTVHLEFEYR